jgi:hypothetical protein
MRWQGWSIAGPWGSTASLDGDLLTIRDNFVMQMTDFEDAIYRQRSATSALTSSKAAVRP